MTPPATTPSRDSAWRTFSSSKGLWLHWKGRKFPTQTFTADPALCITDAPVAVLVNHGTYGAPELTAAAIEDLKRGDVVGDRTFGEGAVQRTIDLPDGAALMLTVAKYEDPDGKKIQDDAVTPNVVVASPEDDGEPMPPQQCRRAAQSSSGAIEGQERLIAFCSYHYFLDRSVVSRSCTAWCARFRASDSLR